MASQSGCLSLAFILPPMCDSYCARHDGRCAVYLRWRHRIRRTRGRETDLFVFCFLCLWFVFFFFGAAGVGAREVDLGRGEVEKPCLLCEGLFANEGLRREQRDVRTLLDVAHRFVAYRLDARLARAVGERLRLAVIVRAGPALAVLIERRLRQIQSMFGSVAR